MAKRSRVYYAKWQMTEGLLAGSKEWMFRDTRKEYTGPYHKYVDGAVMSGGSYNKTTSEFLIPFVDQTDNPNSFIYDEIKTGEDVKKYSFPTRYYPRKFLTIDDYKKTWFSRYFIRRRNFANAPIIEIERKKYGTLTAKGSGLNGNLYMGITLRWRISGNPESELVDGVKHYGIVEANKRVVFLNELKMPGLRNYLRNPEEFSIYNKLTDSSIKQELL